jgi:hypothetical protein
MNSRNQGLGVTALLTGNMLMAVMVVSASAQAQTFRCINAETRHSYISSQSVPRDKCVRISKKDPYEAYQKDEERKLMARIEAEVAVMIRQEQERQAAENRELERRARAPGVSIGMSTAAASASSWGLPAHVSKTTTAHEITEHWSYANGNSLHFRNGKLVSIHE